MASDDFNVLDFNSARRYPGGISKYLFEFVNYVNEHGGGGDIGDIDYNKIKNLPQFKYDNRTSLILKDSHNLADYFIESLDNKITVISLTPDSDRDIREYPSVKAVRDYVNDHMSNYESKENKVQEINSPSITTEDFEHYPSVAAIMKYVAGIAGLKEDVANKVEVVSYNTSVDKDKKAYLSVYAYKNDLSEHLKSVFEDINNILVLNKDLPFPNYFIAADGSDENAGINPMTPAKTLDKILNISEPNRVIYVKYPSMKEYVISDSVNINKNITLICTDVNNSVFEAINNSKFFSVAVGVTLTLHNFSYLYNGEKSFISKLEIKNEGTEPLIIDYEYIKAHIHDNVSLRVNIDDTSNKFNEYLYIDGKYELLGVDDYNDLDNRIRLDGKLLSSESTLEELGIQPKLVSDDSEGKQNLKTLNGEVLTGKGNIVISGGGEASTYASLPDKPELEGHVLNSGNNTLEDLGVASKNSVDSLVTLTNVLEEGLNTAKEDIVNVKNKIATAFDKNSTTTSPSCKAISDYLQSVLDSLDVSEVEL